MTPPAVPSWLTLPTLSVQTGISLDRLRKKLHKHPEFRDAWFERVGKAWCIAPGRVEEFRKVWDREFEGK